MFKTLITFHVKFFFKERKNMSNSFFYRLQIFMNEHKLYSCETSQPIENNNNNNN